MTPTRAGQGAFAMGRWFNEPAVWSCTPDGELTLTTDRATDFWRDTWYGFQRDNGHFFGFETAGDFTAQLRVRGDYQALYDQAGLMVRLDERCWLKAGIEYNDGAPAIGCVLTNGVSDWSTGAFAGDPGDFYLRITVKSGALRLQYSADGEHWPLLRLAPFPPAASLWVGPMACTPERAGLTVRFSEFKLGPPNGKTLHDLS